MIFTEKKQAIEYIKSLKRVCVYVRIKNGTHIKEIKGERIFCIEEIKTQYDYEQIEVKTLKEYESEKSGE